jgi:hypothetical protein
MLRWYRCCQQRGNSWDTNNSGYYRDHGAGWYGCHIAASLQALGFKFDVFEASNQVLDAASGNNQFRLHIGFHYPRHHGTRIQSRDGFQRFIERYPSLKCRIICTPCRKGTL